MTDFGKTVQDHLDTSHITYLPSALSKIGLGELIAGLIPRWISYTGLTSSATQVLNSETDGSGDDQAAIILAVNDGSNTPLAVVNGGVGAGEVGVAYSSEGVPTLTFSGAVTAFKVLCCPLPADLATNLSVRM